MERGAGSRRCGRSGLVYTEDTAGTHECVRSCLYDGMEGGADSVFADVNIDEDECTEQDWFIFTAGRDREEIRHWFDRNYSGGV